MRWDAAAVTVPLLKDSDGTRRIVLSHPSGPIEAVIDTGAEMSVMMESVARRLGARPLGSSSLATTTRPVAGGLAMIDSLTIGTAHLLNVPVAVLPDAQLTLADGTTLPAILGLSALTSAGKAAFLSHGSILALGDAVPDVQARPVQLYWDPSGIGFEARFAGGMRAVHFDTGSRRTYLFPTAARSLSPAEAATRRPFERKIAGLGGERTEQAFRYERVAIQVGGRSWTVAPMEMAPLDEEGEAARIGVGLMDRFETIILDFANMRMLVR
jgi:hypothetical protein